MKERVYLYDSTLRDGSQARGVDFTVSDKLAIARELDKIGIDYIEGGWPGANPNDDGFFAAPPTLKRATLSAFGMTRRSGRSAENDVGLAAIFEANTPSVCLVGKAWDRQVEKALGISKAENIKMVKESITLGVSKKRQMLFDAEHFFDGYKSNPAFALEVIRSAYDAGSKWVVLCDTNGGTLPHEIEAIVGEVTRHINGKHLGIHCHNDTEHAVANSLAAVRAGVRQIQGTMNGIGERCGNANLVSIIPTLMLKMQFETGISEADLQHLTHLSHFIDERLSRNSNPHAAYVGTAAFAHKGGLHVSAMAKDTTSYEHIQPELVGNKRTILVSDKAGRSNITTRLKSMDIMLDPEHPGIAKLVSEVKLRESQGYAYESAEASFELLVRRQLEQVPDFFVVKKFRVLDEHAWNSKKQRTSLSEATVKLTIHDEEIITVAEGDKGPVDALDNALRKGLVAHYPQVRDIMLTDYKVRILTPNEGTKALTRVMIESRDAKGRICNTIGVSSNIIDASFDALLDSIIYRLI